MLQVRLVKAVEFNSPSQNILQAPDKSDTAKKQTNSTRSGSRSLYVQDGGRIMTQIDGYRSRMHGG
jgi:hypothetical protein